LLPADFSFAPEHGRPFFMKNLFYNQNMKKRLLVAAFSIFAFQLAFSQKFLTIENTVMSVRDSLVPQRLAGLRWIPESHAYFYFGTKEKQGCLVIGNAADASLDSVTLADLNKSLMVYNAMRPGALPFPDFKAFPEFHSWKDSRNVRFIKGNLIYLYDIVNKALLVEHELDEKAANKDIEKGHVAYTLGNNLFVKPDGHAPVQLTFDSLDGIVSGRAVHRNEFGINKGTFWSPSGQRLAFYRMDESMVTRYPMYVLSDMPASSEMIRYPFAGKKSHEVTVGVYDLKRKKTVYLRTGEPKEQYLTNISWSKDDKYIYIAVVNREQNSMSLRRYNASTGEQEGTLFTESHEKYVEPEHGPEWVDEKQFIWQSERNGFNHLYLYASDGTLLRQLTNGHWLVTEFLGTDRKGKTAYFMANRDGILNNQLYAVDLATAKITMLTFEDGYHQCSGSSDGKYWIDQYSSPSVPGVQQIRDSGGKLVRQLQKAKDPLKEYVLGETSVFSIRSSDSAADLYCRMIKPVNFDPQKKYPVLVYLYGGPHLQLIRNSWLSGADLWLNYMAQQGYVVFSLDNRGSANRGLEFENAVHRQLGTLEMEDQLAGVEYLKKQSFVDTSRMAVFGWSFGGFMATTMMTRSPGTFKVGIAGGPVIDWSMYEVMYTERYMDSPEENPEGYRKNNLLGYVGNLEGKLLMIHGSSDDVVLWQHSLLYIKKSIQLGRQVDYFVYPEYGHNVRGKDRIHLMQKITAYINANL
jgi:dipeptidyl-peptidase-4